jgi:zinc/manganese transport system permease protein
LTKKRRNASKCALPDMLNYVLAEPLGDPDVRHSLVAVLALSLSAAPVGVFLMLRRMSLVGDAVSHAILPGVAVGFLAGGLSIITMTIGGIVAGIAVALLSGLITRMTEIQEDASLAVFLLLSLALGIVIVTINGIDAARLMDFLFGEAEAKMSAEKLLVIAANTTISLVALALVYRPLVLECVDPHFLRSVSPAGGMAHFVFLGVLVLNLVSGFHALGTLLGVGIMIVPAAISRFWVRDVSGLVAVSAGSALVSGIAGMLMSFYTHVPAGPAVTLVAGALYCASVVFGPVGGLLWRWVSGRHLEA